MSTHPEVLWAQRSSAVEAEKNIIYLTVNLPEINESTLKLDIQPNEISFDTKAGRPEEKEYKFNLKLFGEIDPEKSTKNLTTRSLVMVLRKAEQKHEFWPRLTGDKKIPYVKTDFSKWVDEDEQEGVDEEELGGGMGGMDDMMGGMGGMGGMPGMGGMGGMGGMPGMGGMGGMGAGGMDFEKMMADIKANKDGAGPEGIDPADSDSDDSDGPPPLEAVEGGAEKPAASSSSSS
ncbi:HSP20-like chaperone [Fomitiporia mediterranea MF3/22]|uniref:HSP20-like chaperone n=1 Tax=Fomitiporia mediterranea (strain MF3/22) TaxID=694068 RepID=UPI0004409836|nr:HSP20-like chaperone [Fomitiporia mediterranea MF3/22]EJD04573.1 HSP20-like chaperone [Fomitiporia mediterranea MF3/22]